MTFKGLVPLTVLLAHLEWAALHYCGLVVPQGAGSRHGIRPHGGNCPEPAVNSGGVWTWLQLGAAGSFLLGVWGFDTCVCLCNFCLRFLMICFNFVLFALTSYHHVLVLNFVLQHSDRLFGQD